MATNPLENDPERDRRIRERAYHLWNDEGRPPHREGEFWERARELIGMEDSAGFGQLPNPETTGADPNQIEPVEEAFIQDNLGEFPDRFTDQGGTRETPAARETPSGAVQPERVEAKTSRKSAEKSPQKPHEKPHEKSPGKPSLKAKAVKTSEPGPESGGKKPPGAKKPKAKS